MRETPLDDFNLLIESFEDNFKLHSDCYEADLELITAQVGYVFSCLLNRVSKEYRESLLSIINKP